MRVNVIDKCGFLRVFDSVGEALSSCDCCGCCDIVPVEERGKKVVELFMDSISFNSFLCGLHGNGIYEYYSMNREEFELLFDRITE